MVVYRVVNVEGFVAYRQNCYSVPWRYIGQVLPVRVTETEVIVYGPQSRRSPGIACCPRGADGPALPSSRPIGPAPIPRQHEALLRERFAELGPVAVRFLDGLLRGQRYGKDQAARCWRLLGSYARADVLAALERAVRFGAYSLGAVERILAAQAQPKSVLDALADAGTPAPARRT